MVRFRSDEFEQNNIAECQRDYAIFYVNKEKWMIRIIIKHLFGSGIHIWIKWNNKHSRQISGTKNHLIKLILIAMDINYIKLIKHFID